MASLFNRGISMFVFKFISKFLVIVMLALTSGCSLTTVSETRLLETNTSETNTSEKQNSVNAKLRLNDIWALESIQEETLVLADGDRRPQLEIQLQDMRVMGNDGCNSYFASIKYLDDKKITFGPMGSTRMFCHPMVLPDRFNQQMNKVSGYLLKNLKLRLLVVTYI